VLYITELKPTDLDSVQEICRDSFELSMYRVDKKLVNLVGTSDFSLISRNIISSSTNTFIAVNKNRILGFLSWSYDKSLSSITYRQIYKINLIAVSRNYRDQGIGSELMKYFIEYSTKRGAQIISVSTDENNTKAINFYTKHSFKYSSTFLTLRLFKGKMILQEPKENINISLSKSKEELHALLSQNEEYLNYPFPILFENEIEEKIKSNILDNYLRSLELNFDIFKTFVATSKNEPIGYIIIKEDTNLSSILSNISSKTIKVYRIFDIFVKKDFRGKGIGKYLINRALNFISPSQFDFVEILVPSHNYPLINALVSNGFYISHSMVNLFRR
jgi:ribosomal protein S18 acetylase RimI-like enzyme